MPEPVASVLFVCSQNVCRSIAAEMVFRYLVGNGGLTVKIDSAGTHASPGCLPDPKLCAAAALRGYDLSGLRSRPLGDDDCTRFDLILAADRDNQLFVQALDTRVRVGLLMEYSRAFDRKEVLFPQGERGYDAMLDCIEDACLGLYTRLAR